MLDNVTNFYPNERMKTEDAVEGLKAFLKKENHNGKTHDNT